jgi:predicted RNA binding protein YcfA (HicA-like mRNA interferase family)
LKPITGQELCGKLEQAGWSLKRIHGSHRIFGRPGERKIITVPVHGNQVLKPGLSARIARDANLNW